MNDKNMEIKVNEGLQLIPGEKANFNGEEIPLYSLPHEFIDWQTKSRVSVIERFLSPDNKNEGGTNGSHSPTVVTINSEGSFPFNSADKGVGLILKDELLDGFISEGMELINSNAEKKEKMMFLLDTFKMEDNFRKDVLGTLEFYCKRTYNNILKNPKCLLMYTGEGGDNYKNVMQNALSFQINCIGEIIPKEGKTYQYFNVIFGLVHGAGMLNRIPCALRFWVAEVYNKAPGKNASNRIVP